MSIFGKFKKSFDTLSLFQEIYGSIKSSSGKTVNVTTAIKVSTVFACARVLGEGVAQVPLKLMRESPDSKTREPAKDHRLYNIMAFKPNRWQTSFEYREMLVWHVFLTGNAYSFVNRVAGRIVELYPFAPGSVKVIRETDGTLKYEVTSEDGGSKRTFAAESIWHVRGPSLNSWTGLECVKIAREAIGLAISAEESASALHKNNVRPSGVYSVEGTLNDTQYAALSKWVNEQHAGVANEGKAMILDRAAKWTNTQMTGIDAQALETRRFQIEEICRFARVMPIMVGYSDKAATYASAEQMFLAHVVHTLAPWYQRLEQSMDANLLTDRDRADGLYFNFVEEGLLRGSTLDTQTALLGYVNGGLMTPNEGRAKLDMNPDSDPDSDKLRIPANIVGDVPVDTPTPAPTPDPMIKTLELEIKSLSALLQNKSQPINVDARTTVNQAAPAQAGDVTVNIPEQKAAQFNVAPPNVIVNLPEVAAPQVHVAAPNVTVEAAQVNVDVQPAEVQVHLPDRKTTTQVSLDKDGNIQSAVQIETDI